MVRCLQKTHTNQCGYYTQNRFSNHKHHRIILLIELDFLQHPSDFCMNKLSTTAEQSRYLVWVQLFYNTRTAETANDGLPPMGETVQMMNGIDIDIPRISIKAIGGNLDHITTADKYHFQQLNINSDNYIPLPEIPITSSTKQSSVSSTDKISPQHLPSTT